MLRIGGCPRCGGTVEVVTETTWDDCEKCLQCGWRPAPEVVQEHGRGYGARRKRKSNYEMEE